MHRFLMTAAGTAALSLAFAPAWADGPAAPPPASAFAPAAIDDASISPDGKHLLLLGTGKDQQAANIIGIDDQSVHTFPLGGLDASDTLWASDGYALLGAVIKKTFSSDPHRKYLYHRHVIFTADGKIIGPVLNDSDASYYVTALPLRGYVGGDKPAVIVVGLDLSIEGVRGSEFTRLRKKQNEFVKTLYRVDLATGHGRSVERGNQDTLDWLVDANGEPRVRFDFDQNHTNTVSVRPKGAGGYHVMFTTLPGQTEPDILGYSDTDDALLIVRTENGSAHVVKKSLKDGGETVMGPQAPSAHASVIFDPRTKTVVALETDGGKAEWLDPQLKATDAMLAKAFKGKTVTLASWSSDRNRVVAEVDAGDAPPVWYFYDNARHEVSPIQEAWPALKGAAFGTKTFFTYKAADGLEIPAYLTLPPGSPATGGKLPLVVLPHGGPSAHDEPGFDYLAQFLATRGYAVLQPEFRGSTGFGSKLFEAGRREWGGKMQSDLTDGVKALADKGVIDPSRACIVGWSYGGYAALAGAALTPNAYKCAVSINGVSDLLTMAGEDAINFGAGSDADYDTKQEIGDPSADGDHMDAVSPARHADRVTAPVLLVGGEDDTTVPFKQTQEMYQALRNAGADVKLVTFKGDDHYLHTPADRVAMLQAVEEFLAKNLPVK